MKHAKRHARGRASLKCYWMQEGGISQMKTEHRLYFFFFCFIPVSVVSVYLFPTESFLTSAIQIVDELVIILDGHSAWD